MRARARHARVTRDGRRGRIGNREVATVQRSGSAATETGATRLFISAQRWRATGTSPTTRARKARARTRPGAWTGGRLWGLAQKNQRRQNSGTGPTPTRLAKQRHPLRGALQNGATVPAPPPSHRPLPPSVSVGGSPAGCHRPTSGVCGGQRGHSPVDNRAEGVVGAEWKAARAYWRPVPP